ncbi:acyltransferase family protein [Micromonospora purpureochromogenes]|uniref:Peptidoglycan/LPS O-acetylase OafA/YrhL n=1 Tax=Micromonospora purpureochromogenes TaxID=47872 RepID=A0ABX2RFV3_9ACTN|nr:acyltransferase family protein [Micromonospora purpureochromogenes]NYF55045.1 peptidoglycan/LPS O-acetylase OafA/YrhL [Micromonospora purpureochromogenes]
MTAVQRPMSQVFPVSDETMVITKINRPEPPTPPAIPAQGATPVPAESRPKLFFPAVDGLRGLAILSVLLYHTSWFSNGLFGVDVFMVLSGFLITLLLLREATKTGRISLGGFYRRRFKRLMPGLSITLLLVVALTYAFGGLKEAQQVGEKAIAALFQVANWQQIANSDAYWEGFGRINPLAHMWSLSITEQFYLAWPLVFLLVFWLCRRSVLAVTLVMTLLLVASAAVAPLMYDGTNTDRLYLGTETRAVDFVAGAVAAGFVMLIYGRAAERKHFRTTTAATVWATLIGFVMLVTLVVVSVLTTTYHEPWLYEGGIAAMAIVTAVLIVTLCHPHGPLVKVLSFGPLAEIGRISYTMYLLHLPIFWLMQKSLPTIAPYALFLVGGLLTWLAAMFLHYAVTERIRVRPWRAARAVPTAILVTVAIVAGAWFVPTFVEQRMNPDGRPSIVLLGDSLSGDFAEALASDGRDRYAVVDGSISGCGISGSSRTRSSSGVEWPRTKECEIRDTLWRESLRKTEPIAVVAHFGWDAADQQIGDTWLNPCQPTYRKHYLTRLDSAVQAIQVEVPTATILLMNERVSTGAAERAAVICYNKIIEEYSASGKVVLLDFNRVLCPDRGKCLVTDPSGKPLFMDGVHFTPDGRRFIAPLLEDRLAEALTPTAEAEGN